MASFYSSTRQQIQETKAQSFISRRIHNLKIVFLDPTIRTAELIFPKAIILNAKSLDRNCSSISNVYNMSGRVVSDIQTRAEGESLYIRYNTDANVVNNLKNDSSYKFIGEVILKINVV